MTVCIRPPAPGDYAVAVVHDANGHRGTDISTDGAGDHPHGNHEPIS